MVRSKSKALLSTSDGAGGMSPVKDYRFDKGEWPISFEVPHEQEQSDRWPRYLSAECNRRGWTVQSHGQIERGENSGTIRPLDAGGPQLDIVWERKRGGPMKVRARLPSTSKLAPPDAERFFKELNDSCAAAITEPRYVRGTLQYDGPAWRGEIWLDDKTRLGPPSLQDETAMLGPRIVHVDAMLECIGETDRAFACHRMLQEVSAFLSVVTRKEFRSPQSGRAWTWATDGNSCEVRILGYLEFANPVSMPSLRADHPVPLHPADIPRTTSTATKYPFVTTLATSGDHIVT